MQDLNQLIEDVKSARDAFLAEVQSVNPVQAIYKSMPDEWTILQITEHLVHAEDVGVIGIWKALQGYRQGNPIWTGEQQYKAASIEEITARTWKEKEIAPEIAAPHIGGTLSYWIASLRARQGILEELATALKDERLDEIVYPHPISGPLNARQRLEFLRFHLERHRSQVELVKNMPGYPG